MHEKTCLSGGVQYMKRRLKSGVPYEIVFSIGFTSSAKKSNIRNLGARNQVKYTTNKASVPPKTVDTQAANTGYFLSVAVPGNGA
ncbi:MAG: hypothetical protein KGS48_13415 [Bacteroidetes bacterium]|nr:hypothetical protein [Bacteroidota bacterium]